MNFLSVCALRPIIITIKNVLFGAKRRNAEPAERVLIITLGVVVSCFAYVSSTLRRSRKVACATCSDSLRKEIYRVSDCIKRHAFAKIAFWFQKLVKNQSLKNF